MRAISVFSLDAGMSTVVCDAWMPLRIRVRKSAMGSVIDIRRYLPAALRHSGDVAVVRELAQADAAHAELAEHRARAPTAPAAGVLAGLELGTACLAHALGRLGHALGLLFGGSAAGAGDGLVVSRVLFRRLDVGRAGVGGLARERLAGARRRRLGVVGGLLGSGLLLDRRLVGQLRAAAVAG